MADLIDRHDAYVFLTEYYNHHTEAQHNNLREALSRVPDGIVSCKDCKWYGDIGCAVRIVDDTDKPSEHDFCSFAEREERT